MSSRIILRGAAIFLFAALLVAFQVQAQTLQKPEPQAETKAEEPHDALGRSTPHGTVLGFLQTTQSGKFREAAEYLQLSEKERATRGEQLARQLHDLMDSSFVGRVGRISDQPEGSGQAGVPHNHERIGVFRINDEETDVTLVRVAKPDDGEIWLFSPEVLTSVPELARQIEGNKIEKDLPGFLVRNQFFSTPLWRILAFLLLIPIAFGVAWATVRLLRAAVRVKGKRRRPVDSKTTFDFPTAPATLILTALLHYLGITSLGVPLLVRVYYQRTLGIIVVAGLAWMVFPFINVWGERARRRSLVSGASHSGTMVLLGQRLLKVTVVVVAILVALSILGFNMTTAVAGLGIGSIAIAFAAQKTLENLLGGISILGDEVIRVGDLCRVGEDVGTVEDISLRSTRIRTLDRTELFVPNGKLANMTVENLSRNDRSLFREKIGLRLETSSAQLRSLLAELRTLLRDDSRVDSESARVRLMGFGESSLDIEINCQILTRKFVEFLAIREDLLLQVMDVIANAGIQIAFPSRVLYPAKETSQAPAPEEFVSAARRKAG